MVGMVISLKILKSKDPLADSFGDFRSTASVLQTKFFKKTLLPFLQCPNHKPQTPSPEGFA